MAFKRIVLMLPGVGAKSADKLWAAYNARLADEITQQPSLAKLLRDVAGVAPKSPAPAGNNSLRPSASSTTRRPRGRAT